MNKKNRKFEVSREGENKMRAYFDIGDICNTKFWISFEIRPDIYKVGLGRPYFGKTYNGTKWGMAWQLWDLIIIAHIRDDKLLEV